MILGLCITLATGLGGWLQTSSIDTQMKWKISWREDGLLQGGAFSRWLATAYFVDFEVNTTDTITNLRLERWARWPVRVLSSRRSIVYLIGYGWPMRCCYAAWSVENGAVVNGFGYVSSYAKGRYAIGPILAINVGAVVINTMVYGIVLGGFRTLVIGMTMRRRRRMRLCWYCKYDLRTNEGEVCPECGARLLEPIPEPLEAT